MRPSASVSFPDREGDCPVDSRPVRTPSAQAEGVGGAAWTVAPIGPRLPGGRESRLPRAAGAARFVDGQIGRDCGERPASTGGSPDARPLRRLRGLSARQDRRPRRRRRRPAAGPRPPRRRGPHAPPRLPRRDAASSAQTRLLHDYPALLGVPARLLAATVEGLELVVIDSPPLYDRPGGPYGDPTGRDHPDNWRRFGALGRAAVDIAMGLVPEFLPDLVHAHDWQAGLAPAYLRFYGVPRPSVMTIHNIAFQGGFPASVFQALELPPAGRRPRRRRVLRRRRLPQGRHRQRQRHHHRQPHLRRGDQDPRLRHGPRRPDRRPLRPAPRHRQRHRHRPSGTPRPTRTSPATYTARKLAGRAAEPHRARRPLRPPQRRLARSSSSSAASPGRRASTSSPGSPPRTSSAPATASPSSAPASPASRRPSARSPPSSPAASAPSSATTSRSPT